MIIAQIMGGLGNQLSEYACGYSLAKGLGQELVLDVSDYVCKGYCRPYCLDKLRIGTHRKLVYPPASNGFMEEDVIPEELRARMHVIDLQKVTTREMLLRAAEGFHDIYLLGYGGLQYCTADDQKELRMQYQLKTPSSALGQFKARIREEYSVAVHIRRTDFTDLGIQSSMDYFRAGISYVRIFYPKAQFYFFSDDIRYVKEQFGSCGDFHYVHLLGGMDADLDEFFCISACDGRILSTRSTFSAWAGELNRKEDKLDICQGGQARGSSSRNQVYLNDAAIEALCRQYKLDISASREEADPVLAMNRACGLALEGHNDEAVMAIDQACFDSHDFTEDNERDLVTVKEIALVQKGEEGLPAALRAFYEQMQREHGDPAFHTDYFRALYQSGHILESAIHAGMASRLGNGEDFQEYFQGTQKALDGQELYRLLRDGTARHFVFIPMEGWNYFITYVKTLAALLARMGQKVTLLHPSDVLIPQGVSDGEAAEVLLQNSRTADGLYHYHVDLVPFPCTLDKGKSSLFQKVVRKYAARHGMQTVVVTTVPDVLSGPKADGVKYAVPDLNDPLNRERFFLGNNWRQYLPYMAEHADAIFWSGDVPEMIHDRYRSKIHLAFPAWDGPCYRFLDGETDFTPNYIHSENMILNAAELLKI